MFRPFEHNGTFPSGYSELYTLYSTISIVRARALDIITPRPSAAVVARYFSLFRATSPGRIKTEFWREQHNHNSNITYYIGVLKKQKKKQKTIAYLFLTRATARSSDKNARMRSRRRREYTFHARRAVAFRFRLLLLLFPAENAAPHDELYFTSMRHGLFQGGGVTRKKCTALPPEYVWHFLWPVKSRSKNGNVLEVQSFIIEIIFYQNENKIK